MPPSRKFKKYPNRKLYDLDNGAYISMLELSDVVASGQDVTVYEDNSGRDITFEVLARALYERTKAHFAVDRSLKKPKVVSEPFGRDRLTKLIEQITYYKPAKK